MAIRASVKTGHPVFQRFSDRTGSSARAWIWLGPSLLLLAVFLVYPTVHTFVLSFLDARSISPVGLANYEFIISDLSMRIALRNTLIWVTCFPLTTVLLGLALATMIDRVHYEGVVRTILFMPMAISFVAASVIWKLVFDFRPVDMAQTGLANAALMAAIPGFTPQAWLVNNPPLNTFALLIVAVWVWTGYCTVLLAAALKGVSVELTEAARVDGASELQVFRLVVLPALQPTVIVVLVTMVIFALKAFDIVYVMTSGNFETDVIASKMYKEMFNNRDFGRAGAIAVALLCAIAPLAWINVSRTR